MDQKNSTRIGIITPTFNRPELLKRTIDSVLAQNYYNWVMVIINDCSTVDYRSITDSLKDERIHYFVNEKNSGVNFSRNRALTKIEDFDCDYLTFLDDDDFLAHPQILEDIASDSKRLLEKDWLIYDVMKINQVVSNTDSKEKVIDYINDYLYGNQLRGDKHHLIRASVAKGKRFTECIRNGYEWTYFIQLANVKTVHISRVVKIVEYQEEGLTQKGQSKKVKNILLQTALPTMVWLNRPLNFKALRRMVALSLKLPFRLLISFLR